MRAFLWGWAAAAAMSTSAWCEPPVLENFGDVTFLEPQVQEDRSAYLFPDITITASNPLGGGSFRISGYLQNDSFDIPTGGTGADAITSQPFNGGLDIRRNGELIATYRPTFSREFLINFEDSASDEAVRAVLRNIIFLQSFEPPAEERTLVIRLTDSAGEYTGGTSVSRISEYPVVPGPFDGIDVGTVAQPTLFDLDNDDDLDLVVGENGALIFYFENTGSNAAPVFEARTGEGNPFVGIDHGLRGAPAMGDIDGDDDLDLVFGDHTGVMFVYENTGTPESPVFVRRTGGNDPLSGIDVGDIAQPAFADIDADGDPDLFVASWTNGFFYFENQTAGGGWTLVQRTGAANPLGSFTGGDFLSMTIGIADIDNDGDLDVASQNYGGSAYFRNEGTPQAPNFVLIDREAGPFSAESLALGAFALADLTGDGRVDLTRGEQDGTLSFLPYVDTLADHQVVVTVTPMNDAPRKQGLTIFITEDETVDLETRFREQQAIGDVENDPWTITEVDDSGLTGTMQRTDGRFIYTSHPDDQKLGRDDGRAEAFSVTVEDIHGATATYGYDLVVRGVNDPFVAVDDEFTITEEEANFVLADHVFENDYDVDEGDEYEFVGVDTSGMRGEMIEDGYRNYIYAAVGHFDSLAVGETEADFFTYSATDGYDADATTARVRMNVTGMNDAPQPDADIVNVRYGRQELDITRQILTGDIDPDNGAVLSVTAISGPAPQPRLSNGRVYFTPPLPGGGNTRIYTYTVTDEHGASMQATATVNLLTSAYTVTMDVAGLGSVRENTADIDCAEACSFDVVQGASVTLVATPDNGADFVGWSGACSGQIEATCTLAPASDISVSAIFTGPVLRSAVLPAARSGALGGSPLTVFATVINAGGGTASGCRAELGAGAPVDLSYRAVDAGNNAIGSENPLFDLADGTSASFVLALAPQRTTTGAGEYVDIAFACRNGQAEIIPSVNSVFLSISDAAVPDIIAIAATPTADGSLRIASHGGRAAMGVAAVNIGAPADITVSIDNGGSDLPLDFTLCQSGSDGVCLAPRTPSVTVNMAGDPLFFSVLGVDPDGEATSVPDDAANARAFLRFDGTDGVTRGLTSVGAVSGQPVALDPSRDLLPAGRWSVSLLRDGASSRFERGTLFVLPGGKSLVWTPDGIYSATLSATNYNARRRNLGGSLLDTSGNAAALSGYWFPFRQLRLEFDGASLDGEISGVFDRRSLAGHGTTLAGLEGSYSVEGGGTISLGADGSLSGRVGECIATGTALSPDAIADGVTGLSLTLSSCAGSAGTAGTAVIYYGFDHSRQPVLYLLAAWMDQGFRRALTPVN